MMAEYVQERANERAAKADEQPQDHRYTWSAEALTSLAAYIREGRADPGTVVRVEAAIRGNKDDLVAGELRGYGINTAFALHGHEMGATRRPRPRTDADHEKLLARLARLDEAS